MIAARTAFGPPGSRPTAPALTEQAWLDWDVVDFNYQIEAFKLRAALPADWDDWRPPTAISLVGPLSPTVESDAGDAEPTP